MPSPPPPFHLLRSHHSPLSTVIFNPSNTLLYSGDQDGYITILDLKVRRVIAYWRAHEGGILGLQEWHGSLISHGRDNIIHIYEPLKKPYISSSIGENSKKGLEVVKSLPTNALNFCRFSLLPLPRKESHEIGENGEGKGKGREREGEGLLAVPSLMDSELVDIYHLSSMRRIHASINVKPKITPVTKDSVIPEDSRSGLVMSIHLRHIPDTSTLTLSIGYEDGRVELFTSTLDSISELYDARMPSTSKDNPWTLRWTGKGHNEAIMGMDVDKQSRYAWTVSADHRLVRYDLEKVLLEQVNREDMSKMKDYPMKQIGNSCVAMNASGKVVAVGGWDGRIRLFSAQSLKPLGTLTSHRETVHALSFANAQDEEGANVESLAEEASTIDIEDESDEDEVDVDDLPPKERWLASGGKDTKVALWGLMDFEGVTRS
ncbi:uncharacterized protein I303_105538 [Kwoniella dejecticola CBS 10117]|uniref:ASTRA-associated protein 1 n=1 Tax=Kwoniella dejecticola CBS 10117 TaxID=1296121 RepID=A0A1A6A274_9TREE|nr:uncharacterized protein I303_05019 [Kwoniella dejecticola CBS 10117]OBR84162.1 hypothetical protein I303_05019 [Kwoniella dejecticola CBS 10117]